MKLIFAVLDVINDGRALHVVIKQKVFFYIYICVFLQIVRYFYWIHSFKKGPTNSTFVRSELGSSLGTLSNVSIHRHVISSFRKLSDIRARLVGEPALRYFT